jgi:hypothetical protein
MILILKVSLPTKDMTVKMAKCFGFESVDETDMDELLESHSSELANEDLLEMENNMKVRSPFLLSPSDRFQQNK